MTTPRLHLLPWNRPLPDQAAAWLAADWDGTGPLDLSGLLVVVPTRQSGRRLREALAARAGAGGQAVFPPRVVLPETLATLEAPSSDVASALASQLAWIGVLRDVPLSRFRSVFPLDPPRRDFEWARRLAGQLRKVQATLAEGGWRMHDVGSGAAGEFPEQLRWRQLAELEARYDDALAAHGLRDAQAAKLAFARSPALPSGINRIVLLGTPDPLPLATQILASHADRVPVEVVVLGPADEPADTWFDEWGRPRAEAWTQRVLDLGDFEQRVKLCQDPVAQAGLLAALAARHAVPDGRLALGVADAEVLALLEEGMNRAGLTVFNPEGRLRRRDGLHALLTCLADFAQAESFAAGAALLRCPDVWAWLEREFGSGFSPAKLLGELDALHAGHLPPDMDEARRHVDRLPVAAAALAALARLRPALLEGGFPGNVRAVLAGLFAGRRVGSKTLLAESAAAWLDLTEEIAEALARFPGLTRAEGWELMLAHYAESVRFAEKPAGAFELNGWLELLWEDAPHLVVAGFNDGCVPDAVVGDAFLPESLRGLLGLKTNAARLARDAYLLSALVAMRARAGRLELLVGKVSAAGDPLRPSRLLLRCADADLPQRVAFLFHAVETAQSSLGWRRAWTLRPRPARPRETISVTALRDYLDCPFRFHLRHGLHMDSIDLEKAELDAGDFGTLMHAALETLGGQAGLRGCADVAVVRAALLGEFERRVRDVYGGSLALPLVVQFESARQRLRQAAAVHAELMAEGWRIERVEWKFSLPLGGLVVRGKIDRIDRHPDGRVRVLDYKTSDKPVVPAAAHLRPVRAGDAGRPEWTRVKVGGGERAWIDLQLPLYRRALAAEFGADVACGYFNLPKATGETAVAGWDDLTPALQASAEACADQILAAVRAGIFWPPTERNERDDDAWTTLFHRGAAASVDPAWAAEAKP